MGYLRHHTIIGRSLPKAALHHWPIDTLILRRIWREHAIALLAYALLSIVLSWPTARDFTTHITSNWFDARHNLWIFWHVQQWVLGNEPLFASDLLYYPYGVSLLTHGLGPVTGIFALPFWPWGPEAAYNGATLVSLCLTGYCMYLLARGLGFTRGVALFAGTVLLSSPMVLWGIQQSHMTKMFLALMPLTLLALQQALNPKSSPWWAGGTALGLLLNLLHSGYHFIFTALAIGFFLLVALLTAPRLELWVLLRRSVLLAVCCGILVGPLLLATIAASSHPLLHAKRTAEVAALVTRPDLFQFVLPFDQSRLFGSVTQRFFQANTSVHLNVDNAVALSWTGLLLCLLACLRGDQRMRRWLLFTIICVLFSLGPALKILGKQYFTEHELSIPLPYAVLTSLPGLEFMRWPGRFMQLGYVGLGITASFGLAWLTQRFVRWRHLITLGAICLVLSETWPTPFLQEELPPVPQFYRDIAHDNEQYGVFDIPIQPIGGRSQLNLFSVYQMYQMTHHKGIAWGYISRVYSEHPLFPDLMRNLTEGPQQTYNVDFRVNGQTANPAYASTYAELAEHRYRYVVWHKVQHQYPTEKDTTQDPILNEFIASVFGQQSPLFEDNLVRVYEINPASGPPRITIQRNWRENEGEWRWATSPATLEVATPIERPALLEIVPAAVHDPQAATGIGTSGVLDIEVGASFTTSATITVDQPTLVPMVIPAGSHPITLTLKAGNFQPRTYGGTDPADLSFAIRSVNLVTLENQRRTNDIYINGQPQQETDPNIAAFRTTGWYEPDPGRVRWAASPAELLVYSVETRTVQLALTPALLYAPDRPNGLGKGGVLQMIVNDTPIEALPVRVGQPTTTVLDLDAGWNTVQLELAAGNFRPSDVQPDNGDQRVLSFALSSIDIVTE